MSYALSREQAIDQCNALIDSEPVAPTAAEVAVLRQAVRLARAAGAELPDRLVVRWRRGSDAAARGAIAVYRDDPNIVVYLRVGNRQLTYTTAHECWHVSCFVTDRSRVLSILDEEEEADAFGRRVVALAQGVA